MSLMELFSNYAKGSTGENSRVTAVDRVAVSGSTGNIKNNIVEVNFKNKTASVFNYRTTENPKALLTMVTQGKTLEEARHILDNRYGERLLSVDQMQPNQSI